MLKEESTLLFLCAGGDGGGGKMFVHCHVKTLVFPLLVSNFPKDGE